jgi:hypothetical protein
METDIFVKANHNTKPKNKKISKSIIIDNIPDTCVTIKNDELAKTQTEWRWQFYKIPELGKFVTISYKKNNEERKFINQNGDYIEHLELKEFEQFIKKTLYYYC